MKRQIVLSLAFLFVVALCAPVVSYAFDSSPVVVVDNKEKKDETKATTTQADKKADTSASQTKACGDSEKKAEGCKDASKAEAKSCTGEKKPCCASQKK